MTRYRPVNEFVLLAGAVNFLGLIFRCCYSFARENKYAIEKALLWPGGLWNLVQVLQKLTVSHGTFGYMTVYSELSSPRVLQKAMITRKAFWLMDKVPERCTKVVCASCTCESHIPANFFPVLDAVALACRWCR